MIDGAAEGVARLETDRCGLTPLFGTWLTVILESFSTLKLSALITWPSLDQVTTEPSAGGPLDHRSIRPLGASSAHHYQSLPPSYPSNSRQGCIPKGKPPKVPAHRLSQPALASLICVPFPPFSKNRLPFAFHLGGSVIEPL
jgi:hypothetical protein